MKFVFLQLSMEHSIRSHLIQNRHPNFHSASLLECLKKKKKSLGNMKKKKRGGFPKKKETFSFRNLRFRWYRLGEKSCILGGGNELHRLCRLRDVLETAKEGDKVFVESLCESQSSS